MDTLPPHRYEDKFRQVASPLNKGYRIYILIDPRDDQVRYVGMSHNPFLRYRQHLNPKWYETSQEKIDWIRNLKNIGLQPKMKIIDQSYVKLQAFALEAYWILHYILAGAKLVNREVTYAVQEGREDSLIANLEGRISKLTDERK